MSYEDELPGEQFQNIRSPAARKLLKQRQANEYTRISRRQEGRCFMCQSTNYVTATLIFSCVKCWERRGTESVLAVASSKPYGYCDLHGQYGRLEPEGVIYQLNARLCQKCTRVVAKHAHYLAKMGTENVDPFYKWVRRKQGKDWKLLSLDGSVRR